MEHIFTADESAELGDAVRKLVKLGINARVSGDGFVVSQKPAAGEPIDGDRACQLVLERWPPRPANVSRP